jgi:protein tyrosine phosphatase (PTP) superfamily phosphohydrolase (DUF442 family)
MTRKRGARAVALLGWLLVAAFAAGTSPSLAEEALTVDDVKGPLKWKHAARVYQVGEQIFVGDQPYGEDFAFAKKAGIELVVSLQDRREKDWDERPMIGAHGLEFERVALVASNFNAETLSKVNEVVKANAGRKVLVQCDNGNRAGAWLAFYLVTEKGMSTDDAMKIARRAGLVMDDLADSTRTVIRSAKP